MACDSVLPLLFSEKVRMQEMVMLNRKGVEEAGDRDHNRRGDAGVAPAMDVVNHRSDLVAGNCPVPCRSGPLRPPVEGMMCCGPA